ncbi:Pimeloyl-ACP methyl ester carboxylesterase [Pseudomonas sp. NFACC02]|uniref:alpha/beta fold hydrolase n=1 Tax=Pseudomonas sp. NFACC02 TaxID=1566250 RepID=UPI0008D44956|nr:alpha/beta hydrolase [Pseudomonas sp. NFACC02]SEQ00021.1 Pimeloyl-ACP methyl ester carboxylesterase [Pseudomonas sp. NFACC02]
MNMRSEKPAYVGTDFMVRTDFWQRFRHASTQVGVVNIHYVEGGAGPTLLLIPGWPQSWYAWRYVMPQMVEAGYRVIAVDPRGMGESDAPAGPYDLRSVATELHQFAEKIGLFDEGPINVAGHDVGTWIAYAWAADWPADIRRVALLDALIPGVSAPRTDLPSDEANRRSWHFAFNQLDDLPQLLISGREQAFLTWLFRAKGLQPWTITPEDIAVYARQLAAPGALQAVTGYYQSALSPEGVAANRRRAETPLEIPVLALGAERGVGDHIVKALRALAPHVQGEVILNAGHYLPEEAANRIADELIGFFGNLDESRSL